MSARIHLVAWLRQVGTAGAGLLALGLPVLGWQAVTAAPSTWPALTGSLGLLLAHLAAAVVLQRLLARLLRRRPPAWSYWGAVIGSAGLGLVVWGIQALILGQILSAGLTGWAVLGAFLGGLLATVRNEGFYEISFVPSPELKDELRRRHLELCGPPLAEPWTKAVFDLVVAAMTLVATLPFWALTVVLIWLEDPGPVLFIKNSVGKGGVTFRQFKFRTMIRNAEVETGPIPAREQDDRILVIGRLLRKTNLDELPQLINILRGEMSFVGPRPLRTVVVRDFLEILPQWAERHRVRPGIAGLSQVIGGYYTTPLQKLRFDRVYIRHRGVAFDLKILLAAFAIAFWLRWQKDWDGRLPRHWLRTGSRPASVGVARVPTQRRSGARWQAAK